MGFWIDYNITKLLPFTRKGLWYLILDEKKNWNMGMARIKKGESKFTWRGKDYYTSGMPEKVGLADKTIGNGIDVPTEYETSVNLRTFIYFHDCPYPINVLLDPTAEHLVSFKELAETEQIIRTNHERRAYEKASLLVKKKDNQMLMIIIIAMVVQTVLLVYFLLRIMGQFPKG